MDIKMFCSKHFCLIYFKITDVCIHEHIGCYTYYFGNEFICQLKFLGFQWTHLKVRIFRLTSNQNRLETTLEKSNKYE